MSLFAGAQTGAKALVQDFLLRIAFVLQDVGTWLDQRGRHFEDWVCPSRPKAKPKIIEHWRLP